MNRSFEWFVQNIRNGIRVSCTLSKCAKRNEVFFDDQTCSNANVDINRFGLLKFARIAFGYSQTLFRKLKLKRNDLQVCMK